MIIRAARPEAHFVMVRNSVARDERLSFRARGVLVAILSRPNDWCISAENLAREGQESVQTVYKVLRELQAAGYVERRRVRNEAGQIRTETLVFDEPQQPTDKKPIVGEPENGLTDSRLSSSVNNTDIQKQIKKTDIQTVESLAFANAGKEIAQQWWEQQTIKPIGKNAWHSLLAVCVAAVTSGHSAEAVLQALNEIGSVPSVGHLDRQLKQGPKRFETARERQNREATELHAKYQQEEQATVTELFRGLNK